MPYRRMTFREQWLTRGAARYHLGVRPRIALGRACGRLARVLADWERRLHRCTGCVKGKL